MKKALFIDRDGTLIVEPPITFQVDTLEQMEFLPGVFRALFRIKQLSDFELVMVSNQDGLGTPSYPEENFNTVQGKLLRAFHNEDIRFDEILIDRSLPEENLPTRKPGIGLLTKYLKGDYDLAASWVIGDRITDARLAANLGAKAILLGDEKLMEEIHMNGLQDICRKIAASWDEIADAILMPDRKTVVVRKTAETDIHIEINLDGTGNFEISTGLGFLDHMLSQLAKHSGTDMLIIAKGDLEVDEHHTIEDVALALGEAVNAALGSRRAMERYGFSLPMDDASATVLIDFGGRPWLVWNVQFKREKIGDFPTEMFYHFFKSFSDNCRCNLNIKAEGENEHHKAEAIFKALARSLKMAVRRDPYSNTLPSTKGTL